MMKYIHQPLSSSRAQKMLHASIKASKLPQVDKITYMIHKDNSVVGLVGLTSEPDFNQAASVGVMVLPEWQRQKIAHHAKQLVIEMGFKVLKLKAIYAFCDTGNVAANNANIKLGFTDVGQKFNARKHKWIQQWVIKNHSSIII